MNNVKKCISVALCIIMVFSIFTIIPITTADAATDETNSTTATTLISGDYRYTVLEDGTVSISSYNNRTAVRAVIPSTIDGKRVTVIGNGAFYGYTGFTSVTIPSSVKSIGNWAFYRCTGLTSVTIPSSVTSIGDDAFRGCSRLTRITIPNSVKSIGSATFEGCTGLTSVTIPSGVKSIDSSAFSGCTKLTSVTIPSSVTSIGVGAFYNTPWLTNISKDKEFVTAGDSVLFKYNGKGGNVTIPSNIKYITGAFNGCTGLTSVTIPSSVKSIGDGAFSSCKGLTRITIPNSVTSIGDRAFASCTGLTSVTIPSSVKSIGDDAFNGCKGLTSVTIPNSVKSIGDRAFYNCTGLTGMTIGKSVTSIGDSAFNGCKGLTSVTIPSSVTSIGSSAFYGCKGLTSMTMPSSVTSIGDYAFAYCEGLTSVTIPSSVTSIGNDAFHGCTGLTSVTIPSSVTSIGNWAFASCTGLTSVTIPSSAALSLFKNIFYNCTNITKVKIQEGVTSIGNNTFSGLKYLKEVIIPSSVKSIGDSAFSSCTGLAKVTIPSSVKSIGRGAFNGCTGLTSITIPSSVTSIGDNAFYNCTGLTAMTIGNSVKSIGNYAFSSCTGLAKVTIPSSVTSIGDNAFYYCTGLASMTIPCSVTSIGDKAFQNCTGLTRVTIPSNAALSLFKNIFYNCTNITKVKIQKGVTSIGNNTFSGLKYLKEVFIPNSVTSIGNYAFYNCTGLTSANIPDSVTSIGNGAFSSCTGLTSASIPDSVTSIGNNAFYNCTGLTSANIPDSVTSIGDAAFSGCTELKKISIPSSVTKIEYGTFSRCSSLTNVYLPNSVTSIGDGAFSGCTELKKVTIPKSVTSIGHRAFSDCTGLTRVTIPSSVTSISVGAFYNCKDLAIKGHIGSYAQKFAITNSITFIPIGIGEDPWAESTEKENVWDNSAEHPEFQPTLSLGGAILTFSADNPLAILGFTKMEVPLDNLPVSVKIDRDTVRLAFGKSPRDDHEWLALKKGQCNSIPNNGKNTFKLGPIKADPDIEGYAEGKFKDGELSTITGHLNVGLALETTGETQVMAVTIPVVIKLKINIGVAAIVDVKYDVKNAVFTPTTEIGITLPKITLAVGTGMAGIADISTYGSVKNTFYIKQPEKIYRGVLEGEVGLSASLLNIFYYELPLFSGTWEYYNSAKTARSSTEEIRGVLDSKNYVIKRASNQSKWYGTAQLNNLLPEEVNSSSSTDYNTKTLQKNINNSAEPQLITTDSGYKMMIWVADINSRSNYNHTAVVYSLYNELTDSWSAPQIVNDDGTADFYPQIKSNGDDIYVAWSNANKTFNGTVTPEQIASTCEISVAKFNNSTAKFDSTVTLTSNDTADIKPCISTTDKGVYVSWINNNKNDLLTLTGTNTIYYSEVSSMSNPVVNTYTATDKPVTGMSIGKLNNNVNIAYAVDADGELTTANDTEIFCGAIDGSIKQLTTNTALDQNPQFANIDGADTLLWYSENNISKTSDLSTISTVFPEADSVINSAFKVVNGNGNTAIVCTGDSDNGTDIYTYVCDNGKWSKSVPVTDTTGYVKYANGYFDSNNKINLVYTRTDATVTDKSINQKTDLCTASIEKSHNITANNAEYDEYTITEDGNMKVDLSVTNNGLYNEDAFEVVVRKDGAEYYKTTVYKSIGIGSTAKVSFNMPLDEVLRKTEKYTVEITPAQQTDVNLTDNTYELTVGYTDLFVQISEDRDDISSDYTVIVENLSRVPADATLQVRKDSPNGDVLAEYSLGITTSVMKADYTLTADMLSKLCKDGDVVYFVVVADKEEYYTGDNNDFIVANLPYARGDLNNDGKINMADVMLAMKYVAKLTDLSDKAFLAADVNDDGRVTSADSVIISKYVAKLIDKL